MSGQQDVELNSQAASGFPAWGAAIVNHGSFEDLVACLGALSEQTRPAESVVVWDTGVDLDRLAEIERAYPDVRFESGPNLGYAGGANRAIARLCGAAEGAGSAAGLEFVLVLNPDVALDPEFAERLIAAAAEEASAAIATGKLLRPDRETIDSAGIVFPRHRRPRDRGSESQDRGQFDQRAWVDAASGAAMLLRVALIDRLSVEGELFDEDFFAYHEDTDLSWRARRLGFRVLYEPNAVAVHARGWQRAARRRIPVSVRRHSFKNHYLQIVKNETGWGLLRNAPWLLSWEVMRLGFVLTRDPAMLPAYRDALRLLPAAWRKRVGRGRTGARGA